ncbi:hypothetical protein [Halarcobacter sp.]|uniref:hypothetical protein n=1 Tax=Halarcobacter sp. TaxID=2321133 RepID=UPI002AABECBB|nr:hypothetical protein [Halarcobacter sp.]
MLFTQLEEIESSFAKEFDFNKLGNNYKNLILIAISEQTSILKMNCGADKDNLYLIFNNKDVRKEVADLFNNNNHLNEKINQSKNFIIFVSLEKNLLTSYDTNATVMHVKDITEVLKILDDFKNQNIIHSAWKKVSTNIFGFLWKLIQKKTM